MHIGPLGAVMIAYLWMLGASGPRCEQPQGTVVRIRVTKEAERRPTSCSVSASGKVLDSTTPSIESRESSVIEYRDRFVAVSKSHLQRAEREFLKINRDDIGITRPPTSPEEQIVEAGDKSLLEGKRLSFAWDSASNECTIAFVGNEPSPVDRRRLTEVLKPSFCASFLSPENASADGKTWSISSEQLKDLVFAPGGDLFAIPPTEFAPDRLFMARQRSAYWSALNGSLQASLADRAKEDDPQYSRIDLKGELATGFRITYSPDGEGKGREGRETAKITGVVTWDRKHDRLQSISIDWIGAITFVDSARLGPNFPEDSVTELTLASKIRWDLTCQYESDQTGR